MLLLVLVPAVEHTRTLGSEFASLEGKVESDDHISRWIPNTVTHVCLL